MQFSGAEKRKRFPFCTARGLRIANGFRFRRWWNADTLQQRARFFGYKRKYLSLCRLYLHPDVIAAFGSYVTHEEDVRRQLATYRGKPLREWRRAFFLSAQMRPTRRNVLTDPYVKLHREQEWFVQHYPHTERGVADPNLVAMSAAEAGLKFENVPEFFGHRVAEVSLREIYSTLLVGYQVRGGDMPGWYGVLVTIADILETSPDSKALVMQMQGDGGRLRVRSSAEGAVTLHQGRTSSKRAGGYPGDKAMFAPLEVTIQLHLLRVDDVAEPVLGLAVHIPVELRRDDLGAMGER